MLVCVQARCQKMEGRGRKLLHKSELGKGKGLCVSEEEEEEEREAFSGLGSGGSFSPSR